MGLIIRRSDGGLGSGVAGNNNPDGYAMATTTWVDRTYESEVATHVLTDPGLCDLVWNNAYGYNGTGGWRAIPDPDPLLLKGQNEDNAGLYISPGAPGSSIAFEEAPLITVSYAMYLSSLLRDRILAHTGDFWDSNHKLLDVRQYLFDGTIDTGGGSFRWNVHFGNGFSPHGAPDGIQFSHVAGGGSAQYYGDANNPDWSDFANAWVWVLHLYDGPNTTIRTYMKATGASGVTRILHRDETLVDPGDGTFLQYRGFGHALGERTLWGYWDDMVGISQDLAAYIAFDHVKAANGWVSPPW